MGVERGVEVEHAGVLKEVVVVHRDIWMHAKRIEDARARAAGAGVLSATAPGFPFVVTFFCGLGVRRKAPVRIGTPTQSLSDL